MSSTDATPTSDATATAAAAGAAAAERGASPDEVRKIVSEEMGRLNASKGLDLTDEQVTRIADRVIGRFEERGAFDPPPAPTGSVTPGDTASGTPGTESVGEPSPAGVQDAPPRKLSAAEKFFGRKP